MRLPRNPVLLISRRVKSMKRQPRPAPQLWMAAMCCRPEPASRAHGLTIEHPRTTLHSLPFQYNACDSTRRGFVA